VDVIDALCFSGMYGNVDSCVFALWFFMLWKREERNWKRWEGKQAL
jgi:hypothetical protein